MALVATLGSTRSGDARKRIAAALEDIAAALAGDDGRGPRAARRAGLRLRHPAYTLDHMALAGGLLVQCVALRNVQVPGGHRRRGPTGLRPEPAAADTARWTAC